MGLFGGGNSSAQTENETLTANTSQQGTEGDALNISGLKRSTVNITDQNAIAQAFDFAKASLNGRDNAFNQAVALAKQTSEPGSGVTKQALYIGGGVAAASIVAAIMARGK